MATRKNSAREAAANHNPGDLVMIYHPELLPEGVAPEDMTAVTSYEAYEVLWAEKGFQLLEDTKAEPPVNNPSIQE